MKAAVVGALAVACSCGGSSTVAMHPVDSIRVDAVQGEGVVVFVRPPDPCASGGAFTVVDERGEYLGESAPASHFAVTLSEGEHTIYAWDPHGELRTALAPDVNQVGVARVRVEQRHPIYVHVTTGGEAFAVRKTCSTYRWAELRVVGKNHGELDDWLRATKPYASDRAAGQKWVDANAAETQRHVAMGEKKLEARDERARSSPTMPTSAPAPSAAPSAAPAPAPAPSP